MNQDTIKLVEQYYAAFNGGDMDTFLNLLTDDVIHDINQGKREIGKEAFTQFMACMNNNAVKITNDREKGIYRRLSLTPLKRQSPRRAARLKTPART